MDWRKVSYGCGQEGSGGVWPKMRQRCRLINWPDLDKEKDSQVSKIAVQCIPNTQL